MEEVNRETVQYFQSILNRVVTNHETEWEDFLNHIPTVINEEDNEELYKSISMEDVKLATFQLKLDKAPGLDGFLAKFYQVFWDIIYDDSHKADEEPRRRIAMLSTLNHTFITLVPK